MTKIIENSKRFWIADKNWNCPINFSAFKYKAWDLVKVQPSKHGIRNKIPNNWSFTHS